MSIALLKLLDFWFCQSSSVSNYAFTISKITFCCWFQIKQMLSHSFSAHVLHSLTFQLSLHHRRLQPNFTIDVFNLWQRLESSDFALSLVSLESVRRVNYAKVIFLVNRSNICTNFTNLCEFWRYKQIRKLFLSLYFKVFSGPAHW